MSLRFLFTVLLLTVLPLSPTHAQTDAPPVARIPLARISDPFALYGDGISFSVWRDGRQVGSHLTRFTDTGAGVRVDSQLSLAIPFLMITAYRYDYRSSALWRDGVLDHLRASVDDDGALSAFEAHRDGESLVVVGDGTTERFPLPLYPTNHWNPDVLGATAVLNTLTGRLNQVAIVDRGEETVETAHGPRPARRYEYTGDLQAEVWYDDGGRWVKLRFQGRDGSTIDYRCERCRADDARTAEDKP